MRTRLAALVAVFLFALAGCTSGGGDGIASAGGTQTESTAPGAQETSDEQKALAFAGCMREHGVDLPDPEPNANGGFDYGIADSGIDLDDPAFQDAIQACQDKLPGGGLRENLDDPETQAQLREFAQCMRDNGIDLPDPDPDGGFGEAFADIDRTSPAFQQAIEACRDTLPGRGGR